MRERRNQIEGALEDARSWGREVATAVALVAVSIILFIVIPDRLLSYLSLHVAPRARDTLVGAWWVVSFAFLTWAFVRVQRSGRR